MSPPSDWLPAKIAFEDLLNIMARLRDPQTGCPWDLEQTFESIAPYTIEEAYEVADAIQRRDMGELKDELGDLLLQVVFHAQMAAEANNFAIHNVIEAINDKMIRRHPHVFDAQSDTLTVNAQTNAWEEVKAKERAEKSDNTSPDSALSGVAMGLPSLMRSEKLQKRAARTGFDWTDPADIFDKVEEETAEVKSAVRDADQAHIEEEIGDLLFVCANLARRLSVDPEQALSKANRKFERRFMAMEASARAKGVEFSTLDLEAQERLWQSVKAAERKVSGEQITET